MFRFETDGNSVNFGVVLFRLLNNAGESYLDRVVTTSSFITFQFRMTGEDLCIVFLHVT